MKDICPTRKIFAYLFCTSFLLLVVQQYVFSQFETFRFERITIEDGLPNPSVMDILQDRQGFLWISTVSGIVRYDGYEMKTYHPAAEHRDSLPEREVPKLYLDKSGNIWASMTYQKAKIFRYDTYTDLFIPYLFDPGKKKQPISQPVSSMIEDKLGRLLVGTWGGGLFAIDLAKKKKGRHHLTCLSYISPIHLTIQMG